MKQIVATYLGFALCTQLIAQNKPLDICAAKNWPMIFKPAINTDINFFAYQPTDSTVALLNLIAISSNTVVRLHTNHLSFAFDLNGVKLVFQSLAFRVKSKQSQEKGVAVDIWSWKDSILKSAQLYQATAPDSLIALDYIDIKTGSKVKSDTIKWSWQAWQKNIPRKVSLTKKNKAFSHLTDINPQKEYNWYTTSIIDLNNNKSSKAFLYKPEDFDATKKYPVIISLTDTRIIGTGKPHPLYKQFNLHNAPWLHNGNITGKPGTGLYNPVLSNGILNTAYFASNGYIILEIPSTIETGRPGPAMLEKVNAAVKKLSQYSWADTSRLGIQGQGTSAYFVNYIITQTSIFKAAQESAGQTDLISHYGSIDGKGESMQPYYDAPDGFFGKTLWEDSAAYIWHSPVILANKIQTPLLMLHNKEDMITPFAQSIELFTGMRRLGNRCWLLQYDNEQHTLTKHENQEDFTIRLAQFFDHYLKGAGAPIWMTRGVAAKDRGIITGLEIDTEIKTPPIGGLLRKNTDK